MTSDTSVSQRHVDALGAIARFRNQRRSSRGWLVSDRRFSSAAISRLEHKSFVKQIAFSGEPTLVLTEDGKRLLAERMPR